MWRHYIYLHRRADSGAIFYVGKGTMRPRHKSPCFERASSKESRSAWWRNVANKHGLLIEIVALCKDDTEAQAQEKRLIAEIGRASLVNLTDGGDGSAGLMVTAETRAIMSANAQKPRSKAWVASIRRARKNGGNGGVVKRGDNLPEAWRANIAQAKVGEKNPYFGKPSPPSKVVVNTATGTVYASIARAATAEGVNPKTLYQYLDGTRPNRTTLERR